MSGCYTLLKHPTLQNDTRQRNNFDEVKPVQYRSDCIQCHTNSADYYNRTLSYGKYYHDRSDRWLFYYDSPWWVRPFYYGGSGTMEGATQTVNPRKFGRRGISNPAAPAQTTGSATAAPAAGSGAVAKKNDSGNVETVKPAEKSSQRRNARGGTGKAKSGTSKRTRKKDN